jgi:hypothetical protein
MTARTMAHSTGRLANGDSAQSSARTWSTGVLLITLSLILAGLCCLAFAVWLPTDRERYQDYQAAEPCLAHATAQKDCLSSQPFTVTKTGSEEVKGGRRYEQVWRTTTSGGELWTSRTRGRFSSS